MCFSMSLGIKASDVYAKFANATQAVHIEAEEMVKDYGVRAWTSLIQIPAMAAVVGRPIHSVYTDQVCFIYTINVLSFGVYIS